YVVPVASFDRDVLITYLKTRLPEYMVPGWWVVMDELPLNSNGKIDKKSLPEPDADLLSANEYIAPRNETESALAVIWEELLDVQRVGVNDNFFELGGDSIITIQVVSRARRAGYNLNPRDVFTSQTIARLAVFVDLQQSVSTTAEQGTLSGESGLLPVQQWLFQTAAVARSHYNQHMTLTIDKRVSLQQLRTALERLVNHHDALRLAYEQNATGWRQYYTNCIIEPTVIDLQHVGADWKTVAGNELAALQQNMNIGEGRLVQAALVLTPAAASFNRLFLVIHHLVVDGVSWRILTEDLELLLQQENTPVAVILGSKTDSLRQWYTALETYGTRRRALLQETYWKKAVEQIQPLHIDHDFSGCITISDIRNYTVKLNSRSTLQLLKEVPVAYHTEINDILLAALSLTLAAHNESEAVLVGLEGHGREDIAPGTDISRTVGWFTTMYPVLLDVKPAATIGGHIKHTKEQLRRIPDKGIGYGVLKYLTHVPALQGKDPWEIVFNYLGQSGNVNKEGLLTMPLWDHFGSSADGDFPVNEKLAVNSIVADDQLVLHWSYSSKHFEEGSIKELAAAYLSHLENIIQHCISQETTAYTPVDYGLSDVASYTELDRFLEENYNGVPRRQQLESMFRLSSLQEGMLFHSLYDEQAGAYVEQFHAELKGVDIQALLGSWQHLVKQHTILRTAFYYDVFQAPVQCVYKEVAIPVEILDYRQLDKTAQQQALRDYQEEDRRKGFDFRTAPLMRICLIQVEDDRYIFCLTHHHILLDGWSMPVLLEELLTAYECLVSGDPLQVGKTDSYEDYIRYIFRIDKEQATAYWQQYMNGLESASLLPFIPTGTNRNKGVGTYRDEEVLLDEVISARIAAYVQRRRITVNTLMQGVWAYLLYRYTGQQDVAFGIVVSGRPESLPGVEGAVGMYINTLPFHGRIDVEQRVGESLQAFLVEQLQNREYQYSGLNEIQRVTGITGDLFDSLMVFENYPVSAALEAKPWKLQMTGATITEHTNYPLSIIIMAGKEISIRFNYSNILEPVYAKAIAGHFRTTLEQVIAAEQVTYGDLDILTTEEQHQLLHTFNVHDISAVPSQTVLAQFGAQAAARPEAVAVVADGLSLTYQELDEQSSRFAHYLRSKGVVSGTLVPVCQERSAGVIVSMLGIQKAGGAYVPIDPGYPGERIAYMLTDTAAHLLVAGHKTFSTLPVIPGLTLIEADGWQEAAAHYPVTPPEGEITLEQLMYVIYTSGSTGVPKGVQITHGGVSNLVGWHLERYELTTDSKTTAAAGIGFDAFGWEVWPALSAGATLYILDDNQRLSPSLLADYYEREGITHSFLSTVLIPEFVAATRNRNIVLKYLLTGGDRLPAMNLNGTGYTLVNNYGPTENSVVTTSYAVTGADEITAPPIGIPVSHTRAFILNAAGKLCPVGVPGELCISGAGLAAGYLNRDTLTAEKFVRNHFCDEWGGRMYRSGDLARRLPDGNIEYLGRIDDQVKIRGYRIELGEIENVLQQSDLVKQAVVLARDNAGGNRHLVAYVVPSGIFNKEQVMDYLKSRLPEYMVPALWLALDSLPLTSNGKVDRKKLPEVNAGALSDNGYEPPRNATEQSLAEIWQELLRVERIGIYDNFFELGGDSIITIQVVSRSKRAGLELRPGDIFSNPTIAGLTAFLQTSEARTLPGEQGMLTGNSGMLPVQQWFFNSEMVSSHFNQQVLLNISKYTDAVILANAVKTLIRHHDALRFTYYNTEEGWQQAYGSYEGELEITDLSDVSQDVLTAAITAQSNRVQAGLDIEKGILLRVVLMKTPAGEAYNRLLIVIHHLAIDGVSWRILLEDLALLLNNPQSFTAEKGCSYRQWFEALHEYGNSRLLREQEPYWKTVVQQYAPIRTEKEDPGAVTAAYTASHATVLNARQTQSLLQEAGKAYHTEINDLLLSALACTLSAWNGSSRITVGLEGHGRESLGIDADTSRTTGWFTTFYPVLLSIDEEWNNAAVIKNIKEQLRRIPAKGIGYGVLKYINNAEALQGKDPWDVTFNYLGQWDNATGGSGHLSAAAEDAGASVGNDFVFRDKLAVNCAVREGELVIDFGYSLKHFTAEGIRSLVATYRFHLETLISHCTVQITPAFTPSDFDLGDEISCEELDRFLDEMYHHSSRRAQVDRMYRLSGLQSGMLFHGLYDGHTGSYVEQFTATLNTVDETLFMKSWEWVMRRHTILRSAFYYDTFNIPIQCVYRQVELPLTVFDYRHLGAVAQRAAIRDYEVADRLKGFDFRDAPLMRISLARLDNEHTYMLWSFHHILLDGWSVPILIEELLEAYEQLAAGNMLPAPAEDRYEDYIRYIRKDESGRATAHWRNYLEHITEGSLLPFVSAVANRTKGIGTYSLKQLTIGTDITASLSAYAQRHHITLNTLMQGVWAYLLYRYTGHREVTYGVTVSGRPEDLPGIEQAVGMYINTLPLHTTVAEGRPLAAWLQELQADQLGNREYQYAPLNELQRLTAVDGELFDTLLVFENYPVSEVLETRSWQLKMEDVFVTSQTNYPLWLVIIAGADIHIRFEFNAVLINEADVIAISGHFKQVLTQLATSAVTIPDELIMLTDSERRQLAAFNKISVPHAVGTFVDQFMSQAIRTPDNTALIYEDDSLTYRELDERSNQLAHYLRSKGVKAGALVPLCIERSLEMMVGLIGILKAGAAYVPIDPGFPQDRISYMLEDTAATVIVSCSSCHHLLQDTGRDIIEMDTDAAVIAACPETPCGVQVQTGDLVYVIYTSGSTGRSKGVMLTYHNLNDYTSGLRARLPIDDCQSFGLLSSIATDLGNTVLFTALLNGGCLHVFSKMAVNDAYHLRAYLSMHPVDCIKIVPSHWKALSMPDFLLLPRKMLIFGGEALSTEVVNRIRLAGGTCTIVNHYGPTETTIGKLLHVVEGESSYQETVPVGKPFSNTSVYVVNVSGQLCAAGVPGELLIGGEGVAAGYLNNTALTAEKFMDDPVNPGSGLRFYRTGDIVKYLPDGNTLFIGRWDDQVKIRGYRIELGEIESVLAQYELVSQAVVLAKPDGTGNKRLVGYIVPKGSFDKEGIIAFLKSRLPDYMIPLLFVSLEKLPLTANGKVDRRSLPSPDLSALAADDYVAPRNATEQVLADIWQDLLRLEKVGVHDNFFELGGDSIITIQVVSRARRNGYELSPKDIFSCQTVARLAAQLAIRQGNHINAEQETLSGESGLLPVQQKFLLADNSAKSYYNHHITFSVNKNVGTSTLADAIASLVQYHDALRFAYRYENESWKQLYTDNTRLLEIIHLQSSAETEKHTAFFQQSLDIEKGILFCAVLFLTPEEEEYNQLLLIVHHLAVDGVSWRIISEDLELLLQHTGQPASAVLGAKTSSYRQWYQALSEYAGSRRLQRQLPYWENIAERYVPLRTDKVYEDTVRVSDMQTHVVQLDKTLTGQLLHEVSHAYRTEINDVLLSALAVTLSGRSQTAAVSIGLEGHGREAVDDSIDLSRTVGWFTSIYPVLLPVSADYSLQIRQVKETLRQIPDKGLGYGVLQYINHTATLQGKTPWDVQFNYLGQSGAGNAAGTFIQARWETFGSSLSDQMPASQPLSVNAIIQDDTLLLYWSYSSRHFTDESIACMAASYIDHLQSLIGHCIGQTVNTPTPADFGLSGEVSIDELDSFLGETFSGGPRSAQLQRMYHLSGLQEGMLFHNMFDNSVGTYVEQFTGELPDIDVTAFIGSWNYLLQQHSVLRTGFYSDVFSIPVQCVYKDVEVPVVLQDYRKLDVPAQQQAIREYEQADKEMGFDFTQPPLMRIYLARLDEDRYYFCWTYHHILVDGWSMPVLMDSLLKSYEQLTAGKSLSLPVEDRYEDYIQYIEQQDKDKAEAYWKCYLADVSEGSLLPFINAMADRNKGAGTYATHQLQLDAGITMQLSRFAQRHRITLNTLVQGVWAYLLYCYTGRREITYGITVSGRPDNLPGIERAVGMYINTLPFHTQVDSSETIAVWLHAIQQQQLESREHQFVQLAEVQRWTGVQGDLFDSLFVYENYPARATTTAGTLQLQVENGRKEEHTNYPLGIAVTVGDEVNVYFSYNSTLLAQTYMEAIAGHFRQAILTMTNTDNLLLKDVAILSAAEQQQLLYTFNDTAVALPAGTILEQFAAQVKRTPDALALVTDREMVTYRELDERSGQLAAYLLDKGVRKEMLVPLCLERSPEMIISILGIIKSGAAYVPIDPDYPQERIRFILEDTAATMLVSSSKCIGTLPAEGLAIVLPDAEQGHIGRYNSMIDVSLSENNLAYVIYTSGSTGKPKGVLMEHRGVVNMAAGQKRVLHLKEGTRCLQFASFGFDASCYEVFNTLLSGGTLVLPEKEDLLSEESFGRLVERHQVEVVVMPASYLHIVKESLGPVTTVVSAGEPLNREDARYVMSTGVRMYNAYGPTENAVCTTITDQPLQEGNAVVIGRPADNIQVYIRNEDGNICPIGVAGEICVGGDGVARGYLNRPELTAGKFITNPYGGTPGMRLYRTGDLGRWLPDGSIEFLGRIDDQVKIRGFRIEPGEIESVLQQCEFVNTAVVAVKKDVSGNKRLIGYVIPEGTFNREGITAYLKERLPEYMVPAILMPVEKIPLTPNGKIDRKALPEPDGNSDSNYTAPQDELQGVLASIWQDLLQLPRVGINDNFFKLGGHSLLAMRLIAALYRTLQTEVTIKALFSNPTIAALSAHITGQLQPKGYAGIERKARPEYLPLSFNQERLWFIDQLEGSIHYNIPAVLRLKGHVDRNALERAVCSIVDRHEVLRTVILEDDGKARQHILDKGLWQLQVLDCTGNVSTSSLRSLIRELALAPFSLATDHMLRAHLLLLKEDAILVLVMHHVAFDGWSLGILTNELAVLYDAFASGKEAVLPQLPIQYADFAIWQRAYLSPALLDKQLEYWQQQLEGTEILQLSTDFQRPALQSRNGAIHAFVIRAELLEQLRNLSRSQDATLFMTLLAAFKVLLLRYSGQEDICVGSSIAGRNRQETEGLIGFFVNTLALRSHPAAYMPFTDFLQQIREITLNAYEHQDLPFEKVVEAVVKTRDLSRTPLFQVMFELHNTPEIPVLKLGDIEAVPEEATAVTAQFDFTVNMLETGGELCGYITYCTDLYNEDSIARMSAHFEQLLRAVTISPDTALGALSMLTTEEHEQLLKTFNSNIKSYPDKETFVSLFEVQVQRTPAVPAIVFEEHVYTYQQLDERANQLAHYLRGRGVVVDLPVPVCLERSHEMAVAILGIMKAGGAYVPIDPAYPEDRIRFMLE
ncbi:MAG TPA: amino acid adenylation domain-containing protein, partial [Chitinophaga sp.]|uniref:non-ribosomal peptide synthetase n=1 Tax=Chitinophaga sp. TaxID=1869181 RepID=UPI002C2B64CE